MTDRAELIETYAERLESDLAYAAPEMWATHIRIRLEELADDLESAEDDDEGECTGEPPGPEHEHEWLDATTAGDEMRQYVCAICNATKEEFR